MSTPPPPKDTEPRPIQEPINDSPMPPPSEMGSTRNTTHGEVSPQVAEAHAAFQGPPPAAFGRKQPSDWRKTALVVSLCILIIGGFVTGGRWLAGALVDKLPYSVDQHLGETVATATLSESRTCTNPKLIATVQELVDHLTTGVDPKYQSVQVYIVEDERTNAFALPGGTVFVLTGLLDSIESPEELIGVLGHELGHVVHRHGLRRLAQTLWIQLLLGHVFGGAGQFGDLFAAQAANLMTLEFSRDQESESDAFALALMRRVGYDAGDFPDFFTRLPETGAPEWFSSHPNSESRARLLRASIDLQGPLKNPTLPPTLKDLQAPCHLL